MAGCDDGGKEPKPETVAAATPWHNYDWDAVIAGQGFADRYFLRAGLVRKDRLAVLAPPDSHPETAVLHTFEELASALEIFCASPASGSTSGESDASSVHFVLKKAQSSNASGIRFLTRRDAQAVIHLARPLSLLGLGVSLRTTAPVVLHRLGYCIQFLFVTALATALSAPTAASKTLKTVRRLTSGASAAAVLATGFTSIVLLVACGTAPSVASMVGQPAKDVASELFALLAMSTPPGRPPSESGKAKEPWVLQRHIRPWLHEGRKFHLRALLLCVGDLRAWVHDDVRALVATEAFALGCRDGGRVSALLTNMGVSRQYDGYSEASQNLPLTALGAEVAAEVFSGIVQVLGATLVNVKAAGRRQFFTTPNCWELFGVDLLVEDVSRRVVLLEINPSPSLAMYGGPGSRPALVGPDPLHEELPEGWRPVPLNHGIG